MVMQAGEALRVAAGLVEEPANPRWHEPVLVRIAIVQTLEGSGVDMDMMNTTP